MIKFDSFNDLFTVSISLSFQVGMETKMASLTLILLASLVYADARYSKEPVLLPEAANSSSKYEHTDDTRCNSCLEASRKAERALKEMNLLKQFDVLSTEVCHFLPGNFETQVRPWELHCSEYHAITSLQLTSLFEQQCCFCYQCLHKSMMQIRHAKFSLQELFGEKSLCNSTGLCINQPKLQDEAEIFVENKMLSEVETNFFFLTNINDNKHYKV